MGSPTSFPRGVRLMAMLVLFALVRERGRRLLSTAGPGRLEAPPG